MVKKKRFKKTLLSVCSLLKKNISLTGRSSKRKYKLYGSVGSGDEATQERFIFYEDTDSLAVYHAPFGLTPVPLHHAKRNGNELSFLFPYKKRIYSCLLHYQEQNGEITCKGFCKDNTGQIIEMKLGSWSDRDYSFHGRYLKSDEPDIEIIDSALKLLQNGKCWNRHDDRICDRQDGRNSRSLFCALFRASLDVTQMYKHYRPAMEAVRMAIIKEKPKNRYRHIIRDFNNEAESFEEIKNVLLKARKYLQEEPFG